MLLQHVFILKEQKKQCTDNQRTFDKSRKVRFDQNVWNTELLKLRNNTPRFTKVGDFQGSIKLG